MPDAIALRFAARAAAPYVFRFLDAAAMIFAAAVARSHAATRRRLSAAIIHVQNATIYARAMLSLMPRFRQLATPILHAFHSDADSAAMPLIYSMATPDYCYCHY